VFVWPCLLACLLACLEFLSILISVFFFSKCSFFTSSMLANIYLAFWIFYHCIPFFSLLIV
jgi:hypothetical protein